LADFALDLDIKKGTALMGSELGLPVAKFGAKRLVTFLIF
jgi:hypothetical protein